MPLYPQPSGPEYTPELTGQEVRESSESLAKSFGRMREAERKGKELGRKKALKRVEMLSELGGKNEALTKTKAYRDSLIDAYRKAGMLGGEGQQESGGVMSGIKDILTGSPIEGTKEIFGKGEQTTSQRTQQPSKLEQAIRTNVKETGLKSQEGWSSVDFKRVSKVAENLAKQSLDMMNFEEAPIEVSKAFIPVAQKFLRDGELDFSLINTDEITEKAYQDKLEALKAGKKYKPGAKEKEEGGGFFGFFDSSGEEPEKSDKSKKDKAWWDLLSGGSEESKDTKTDEASKRLPGKFIKVSDEEAKNYKKGKAYIDENNGIVRYYVGNGRMYQLPDEKAKEIIERLRKRNK